MATTLLGTTVIPPFLGLSNADTRDKLQHVFQINHYLQVKKNILVKNRNLKGREYANGATIKRCVYTVHNCRRLDAVLGHRGKTSRNLELINFLFSVV